MHAAPIRATTRSEARCIKPAVHSDLYGCLYTPSDSTGDIHKFSGPGEGVPASAAPSSCLTQISNL